MISNFVRHSLCAPISFKVAQWFWWSTMIGSGVKRGGNFSLSMGTPSNPRRTEVKRSPSTTRTSPELILLDLNMPILDGWGFLAERASYPQLAEVPVVIMSAASGIAGRAMEAGVRGVMRKPIMPQALLQVIERYAATA
jgi:CheY-like chemotaxis protein